MLHIQNASILVISSQHFVKQRLVTALHRSDVGRTAWRL